MKVLDLFSGIGGFSLGLERAGMETTAFCELDPFCRAVLARHWPTVRCHPDVRTLDGSKIEVDVICGGFPCIDISSNGKIAGIDGPKSGLWREFARIIGEVRPRYAIVENVSDLLHRGIDRVLGDLAEIGYDAEWHCISASFVGMPQARERVWIIAYPSDRGCEGSQKRHRKGPILVLRPDDDRLALAQSRTRDARSWVSRADDGVPSRVDKLRALGNAIVPEIAEIIGRAIMMSSASEAVKVK